MMFKNFFLFFQICLSEQPLPQSHFDMKCASMNCDPLLGSCSSKTACDTAFYCLGSSFSHSVVDNFDCSDINKCIRMSNCTSKYSFDEESSLFLKDFLKRLNRKNLLNAGFNIYHFFRVDGEVRDRISSLAKDRTDKSFDENLMKASHEQDFESLRGKISKKIEVEKSQKKNEKVQEDKRNFHFSLKNKNFQKKLDTEFVNLDNEIAKKLEKATHIYAH